MKKMTATQLLRVKTSVKAGAGKCESDKK